MSSPVDYSRLSDTQLAAECAVRPPRLQAWDVLYKRFRSVVEAKIRRMSPGVPEAEVEELRQEIFFRVFQYLPKYRASRGAPVTFILTIAASVVIDAWRRRRAERESTVSLEDRSFSVTQEAAEPAEIVRLVAGEVADSFPDPLHRRIAHLVLAGRTVKAIIAEVGAKDHVVYQVHRELRQNLRVALSRYSATHDPGSKHWRE